MARKNPKKKPTQPPPAHRESPAAAAAAAPGGGTRFSRLWLAAAALVAAGYAMLLKVDPAGQNLWAAASPAFLLAGYLLIIPAIWRTFRD